MKSMSFRVFSYNATYFSFNSNQPSPTHHMCWKMRPNQPNPWMDPTHVRLCNGALQSPPPAGRHPLHDGLVSKHRQHGHDDVVTCLSAAVST